MKNALLTDKKGGSVNGKENMPPAASTTPRLTRRTKAIQTAIEAEAKAENEEDVRGRRTVRNSFYLKIVHSQRPRVLTLSCHMSSCKAEHWNTIYTTISSPFLCHPFHESHVHWAK